LERSLAILETLDQLNILAYEGKVGKIDQNGISLYLSKA